jgi:hypothetical protein
VSRVALWLSLWRWRWWRDAGAEIARRAGASPRAAADEAGIARLRVLMHEIERVARWMPRSRCLDRALALLECADAERIPAELCIGVRPLRQRLLAHAWVQSGDVVLDPDVAATAAFARLEAGAAVPGFGR